MIVCKRCKEAAFGERKEVKGTRKLSAILCEQHAVEVGRLGYAPDLLKAKGYSDELTGEIVALAPAKYKGGPADNTADNTADNIKDKGHSSTATAPEMVAAIDAIKTLLGSGQNNDAAIAELKQEMAAIKDRLDVIYRIETQTAAGPVVTEEMAHNRLPLVAAVAQLGVNVCMVGPAGSGKTTLAAQVAKILGRPFYMSGAILQKYELLGFVNANGVYVRTAFRDAFELGGVFLWDEVDASIPSAMVAFNAAMENETADFPDGMVDRSDSFVCLAAANTYLMGGDIQYVGRNALDAATIDRFFFVDLPYDEKLECAIAGVDYTGVTETLQFRQEHTQADIQRYVDNVRKLRAAAAALEIKHVISPRASIKGAAALRAGIAGKWVEDGMIWKGLEMSQRRKIERKVREDV